MTDAQRETLDRFVAREREDPSVLGVVLSGSLVRGWGSAASDVAAQLEVWLWYIGEAEKRGNRYLASWSASQAVLFACRVILAHNRILFPFHKWMLRALEEAAEQPAGLTEAIDAAVTRPTTQTVHAVCDLVLHFRDWPKDPLGAAGAFHRDTEQAWMRHEPGIDNL